MAGRNGFEHEGDFYSWHVSDMGKDLMLIDRFSGMPVTEFFSLVDDGADEKVLERGPVLLALIATSIRHAKPDWSVERITRAVLSLHLGAVEFVFEEEPEPEPEAMRPPSETTPAIPPPADEHSSSPHNGSSSSSTPAEPSASETSYATRL